MVSLVSFLDENARRQPDQLAYVVGDDSLQIAYSAGAPLLNRVRTEFGRMFGCRVLDCYGIGLTHCTGGGISGYDHAVCTIHILTATESATHGQAVTFRAIADGTLPR